MIEGEKFPCGHDKIGCDHYNREGDCTHISDQELLELAAKAAGITFHAELGDWHHQDWCRYHLDGEFCTCAGAWNPLKDDGDAFRLAVKLGLYLEIDRPNCRCSALPELDNMPFSREPYGGKGGQDSYAAMRRAIVRAGAEIGKAMP